MSLEIDGVSGIIKNTTSDGDITIKGNDGGSEISALTFDISAAGAATFNNKIVATELDISGDVDVDGTTNLDIVDIDGAVNMATTLIVGGVITVIDGSTSAPSITNAGDTNSGIYFPADDNIGLVVGGSRKLLANSTGVSISNGTFAASGGAVFNEGSADVDFRVESNGKTHALFVDGGNDRVGFITAPDLGHVHIRIGDSGASVSQFDALVIEEDDNCGITLLSGTTGAGRIVFGDSDDNDIGAIGYEHGANDMIFVTSATERMRIETTGKIGINTTNTGTAMLKVFIPDAQYGFETLPAVNQTYYAAIFRNSSGNDVGRIESTASATSFVTSSDYRLKENVSYDFDATTRLKQLKPSRFNFINTPDTTVDGFLAHEVSSIVPEAISGTKDATETKEKVVVNANGFVIEEGVEESNWTVGKSDILYTAEDKEVIDSHYNVGDIKTKAIYPADSTWAASKVFPVYQAIDQSKLVPLLVKTIQELEARITTLEG